MWRKCYAPKWENWKSINCKYSCECGMLLTLIKHYVIHILLLLDVLMFIRAVHLYVFLCITDASAAIFVAQITKLNHFQQKKIITSNNNFLLKMHFLLLFRVCTTSFPLFISLSLLHFIFLSLIKSKSMWKSASNMNTLLTKMRWIN